MKYYGDYNLKSNFCTRSRSRLFVAFEIFFLKIRFISVGSCIHDAFEEGKCNRGQASMYSIKHRDR